MAAGLLQVHSAGSTAHAASRDLKQSTLNIFLQIDYVNAYATDVTK